MTSRNLLVGPVGGSRLLPLAIPLALLASVLLFLASLPVLNAATATPQIVPAILEDSAGVALTSASAGASNESSQETSYVVALNSGGASLFAEAPTISENGTLSFVPAANANGTATLTVSVKDDGGVANGGVDTAVANSRSGLFTVVISPGDDTPTVTPQAVAVTASGSSLVLSTDGGVTSAAASVGGSGNFNAAAVVSDGTKIVAARGTLLYRYNGSAWSSLNIPAAAAGYVSVASSADGLALVAVSANSKVQVSADSGTTWSAVGSAQNWRAVASSSDGAKLATAAHELT